MMCVWVCLCVCVCVCMCVCVRVCVLCVCVHGHKPPYEIQQSVQCLQVSRRVLQAGIGAVLLHNGVPPGPNGVHQRHPLHPLLFVLLCF